MSHNPTPEQAAIVDAAAGRGHLVIEAGAGAGKTSTLKLVARRLGGRGLYVAYNKAIQLDAERSFPGNVLCKTAHGLAYGPVGSRYRNRLRAPRMPARQVAQIVGLREPVQLDKDRAPLAPQTLARIVRETLQRFCYSADERIQSQHVPVVNGVDSPAQRAELARYLVPYAQRAWDEEIVPLAGRLPFSHDCYLKIWALSRPQLGADYVLMDEAQDANPCVAGVVASQQAQQIWVGDSNQAIYGWRGATDALATAHGQRLMLSQSFRFGEAVAGEANKWLSILRAKLRLRGFDQIPSRLERLDAPDAILCRSNAQAVKQVAVAIQAGRPVALVGGGREITALAEAAIELQTGRGTSHPELCAFTSWNEVLDYVTQDSSGSDLRVAVDLIEAHGAEGVIRILDGLVDENRAELVVSTAHKAKGREWHQVRIADDFREPRPTEADPRPRVQREDAMLAYVAVTRAQRVLDRGGLEWVDRWLPFNPGRPTFGELLDASSIGQAAATVREEQADRLTGMREEQADWDADEAEVPVQRPARCPRCCGAGKCPCDPAALRRWLELTGATGGAR